MIGPVRIVIGEDQALLRHSLVRLLEDAEAVGYLLKDRVADLAVFDEAVRRVGAGGTVLDLAVVTRMLGRARRADPVERLSEREREVLALMAEGRSNRGIADAFVVTPHAVEKHVTSIFSKLGIANAPDSSRRVLAVLAYLRS
jgi:DNA-binding NarL/FixJ family response regulator